MTKVTLKEDICWVGAVDWNIRDFHGYITKRGSTYNAYLILDDKVTLVDTVKHAFSSELIASIKEIIDPSKIDYIIINHVEMDHSSSLPEIAKLAPNATIVASERGKDALIEHYGAEYSKVKTVKTGDQLKIGKRTLAFVDAAMLHWPDSMFTYIVEDQLLMPNDAFGQHLATSRRFNDEVDEHIIMEEAATYYANILMLLGPLIVKKVEEVVKMGIPIAMIAPSHGVIWRKDPMKIVQAYMDWSTGKATKNKISIVYDTMWGSTDKMARAIAHGAAHEGVEVKLMKLRSSDNTEALTEILDSKAVIVGSPTLNNGMFPTLSSFLTYACNLKPKDKLWTFFGSFGWGGGAVRAMTEMARKAGFEVHESGLEIKYIPDENDLKRCFELGKQIAAEVKAKA
jgi:anaerobic nitric oxide reductase flavorubredoxin